MNLSLSLSQMFGTKIMNPMDIVKIDTTSFSIAENPLVIYHANCADGFSAAWVFHRVSPIIEQDFDFHPGVYGEDPPDVKGRYVYLVDFSYKRDVIKKMFRDGALGITIIDHHKTAIEDLKKLDEEIEEEEKIAYTERTGKYIEEYDSGLETVFDLEMSGATLAWKYWEEEFSRAGILRPPLLAHIEDRDLWRFKLPMTEQIQANVFSYEYTFENWDTLMSADRVNLLVLAEGGQALVRKHHKDIAELLKVTQRMMRIGNYDVPVASLPYTLTSDAGHSMAHNFMGGQMFAACYWDTADFRIFSLRSASEGLDVSEIAKEYGGGGHKHAAGFKVPRTHYLAMS